MKTPPNKMTTPKTASLQPDSIYQRCVPFAAFVLMVFVYLAITAQDLFFVVQSQDYFVYDWMHFDRISIQPGWGVSYAGSFLTQFAYYPLLGIALFVLLLSLLAWLIVSVFRLPRCQTSLAMVPSLLLVMFVVGWDYGLFGTRHYGNLFSPVVGLVLSISLIGVLNLMRNVWLRRFGALVAIILLYPVLGVYALFAVMMSVVYPSMMEGKEKPLLRRFFAGLMILVFMLVVYVEAKRLFPSFNSQFAWLAGLPFMDYYKTQNIWHPIFVLAVYLFFLPVISFSIGKLSSRMAAIVSGMLALAAVVMVPVNRFNDSNFRTLLAVEHAYGVGEDDRVLELCATQERPIRSIILYRNHELWKRGELLDKMFQYTWVSDTIQSANLRHNTYITGARVYQQYTFWNFSYRWAMERMVMYNPSYTDMQIMATDIVYNQEYDLADKYLSQLEHTLYYRDWAKQQRRLLNHDVWNTDSLTKIHRQVVVVPHGAIDNTEYCEHMLLKYFTNLYMLTELRAELCLAACMIMDKEDEFWQIVLAEEKAKPGIVLPRHVQEAALLFALKKQNQSLMSQIKRLVGPDGPVCRQFERNQNLLQRLCTNPTQSDANTLAVLCQGTYWNYYFNESRAGVIFD